MFSNMNNRSVFRWRLGWGSTVWYVRAFVKFAAFVVQGRSLALGVGVF